MGLVLKRAVVAINERFDYVIIDCPPVLGVLLINALAACERLIVPVQTEFLAIKGLERMRHTLRMVARSRTGPLDVVVVPTFFDSRTRASRDSLEVLRREHAEYLWDGIVPIDTRFREASRAGLPPATFDPRARGVKAYADLLEQLVQRQPRESQQPA
jgi:chromosome partitioning protein